MKKAIITGVTGHDGSYLTEFLLAKGYEVHGLIRRHSTPCDDRIAFKRAAQNGCAEGYTFVRVDILGRLFARDRSYAVLDCRYPGRSANEEHL